MQFQALGLRAELSRAVIARGYTQPTPIQAQAIPQILAGRDILAGAQTGTGKTAAFALPILHMLSNQPVRSRRIPRVLILTPTRELAAQVGESMRVYGQGLPLKSAIVFGGVGIRPQIDQLRRGVDILVATPGRLLDHASQRTVDLSQVEILVLDEGDRMLDMGFIPDIRRILRLMPPKRQNMLFSATYSDEIRRLADDMLDNPVAIEVARRNEAAELVSQVVHPVAQDRKRALLAHLIREGDWRKVLVFTRTKHGASRLAKQLETEGVSATAIHGDKTQAARTRALSDFKRGSVRVLVATDVASRGLDISHLPHVVNYDMPVVPEDYIHRIGRTGRAGLSGIAVSMVCADERQHLAGIQRLLRREIPIEQIAGFEHEFRPVSSAPSAPAWLPKRGGGAPSRKPATSSGRGGRPSGRPVGDRSAGGRPESERTSAKPENRRWQGHEREGNEERSRKDRERQPRDTHSRDRQGRQRQSRDNAER